MLLVYLLKMPSLTEGFYWLAGALTYQLPNIATLTTVTLLLSMRRDEKKVWKVVACVFLCVIICGGNETSMLEFIYILVALMLFEYASTRYMPRYYYLLLVVSMIAASIIMLAPGNAVRAGYYHGETNVFNAFFLAAQSGFGRLGDWLFDLSILLILFLPFLRQVEIKNTQDRKITAVMIFIYPLFFVLIIHSAIAEPNPYLLRQFIGHPGLAIWGLTGHITSYFLGSVLRPVAAEQAKL